MPRSRPSPHSRTVLVLAAAFTSLIAACDSNPVEVQVSISASETSIFLDVGQTRHLDIMRTPGSASFHAISDDLTVATVTQTSSSIAIVGVCEGFATIVLSLPAHPGFEFQITVEVEDDLVEPTIC